MTVICILFVVWSKILLSFLKITFEVQISYFCLIQPHVSYRHVSYRKIGIQKSPFKNLTSAQAFQLVYNFFSWERKYLNLG